MKRKRLGLYFGIFAALIALGYGIYTLGTKDTAAPAQPADFRFMIVPLLAAAGGWMADNSAYLAAVLLGVTALAALWFFGLALPVLIFAGVVGAAALLFWVQEL